MKELPPDFDMHPLDMDAGDCWICAFYDEPAWFWHNEIPPPGSLAEQMAKVREAARLVGLELERLAVRQLARALRWWER